MDHLHVFGCAVIYAHIPKGENLTQRQESAYCLDMAVTQRGTGCMIQFRRYCIVVMFVSMKKSSVRMGAAPKNAYADSEVRCVTLELSSELYTDPGSPNMPDDPAPQPELRRWTRQRYPPDHYGTLWSHLSFKNKPTSFEEATAPCSPKWMKVIKSEMKLLSDNNVWDLAQLPIGKKAVESK